MIARFTFNERTLDLEAGVYSVGDDFLPPPAAWSRIYTSPLNDLGGELVSESAANRQFSFKVRILANGLESIEGAVQRLSSFVKLYRQGDLYFEFRAGSLPEPLWGQFGAPYRYQVVDANVAMGSEYADSKLRSAGITVTLTLTVKPLALGTKQRLGSALGGVWLDTLGMADGSAWGLRIPESTTNKMTNPVFGNATWNNGWTAAANIIEAQSTDPAYCFPGSMSSALLSAKSSTNNTYTMSINAGNTNAHSFSAIVARTDGGAVDSNDCVIYYNAAKTTTFQALGNGLYLIYSDNISGINAGTATGIQVKSGRTVYLLAMQMEEKAYHTPIGFGDMLGWSWSGTVHASTSARAAARVRFAVANDTLLPGVFSIHMIWKPDIANTAAGDKVLFSATNVYAFFRAADDKFVITDSVNTAATGAAAFSIADTLEILFTAGPSGLAVYAKNQTTGNTYSGTAAAYTPGAFPSVLYIGSDATPTAHCGGIIQLFDTYDIELTSAQNTLLQAAVGGLVGKHIGDIPAFWTKDGDDILDNHNDSGHDNWGVALGVPGNEEAVTGLTLAADNSGYTLYLSRFDHQVFIDPGLLYADLSGSADAGSSGGAYRTIAATTTPASAGITDASYLLSESLAGKDVYIFARMQDPDGVALCSARAAIGGVVASTSYKSPGVGAANMGLYISDPVSLPSSDASTFMTRLIGIYGDAFGFAAALYVKTSAGAHNILVDYFVAMPRPLTVISNARILTEVENEKAFVYDGLGTNLGFTPVSGDYFSLAPQRYNMVTTLNATRGTGNPDITRTVTFSIIWITPRWGLI